MKRTHKKKQHGDFQFLYARLTHLMIYLIKYTHREMKQHIQKQRNRSDPFRLRQKPTLIRSEANKPKKENQIKLKKTRAKNQNKKRKT